MLTTQALTAVIGVSSLLGLLGLLSYLYFTLQLQKLKYSIQDFIGGDRLFNADQVLKILSQFTDDPSRLEAIKILTNYDSAKAADLLIKVKDNIDVRQLSTGMLSTRYRYSSLSSGVVFLLIAVVGLWYTLESRGGEPSPPLPRPSPAPWKPVADLNGSCPTTAIGSDGKPANMIFEQTGRTVRWELESKEFVHSFNGKFISPDTVSGILTRVSQVPTKTRRGETVPAGCDVEGQYKMHIQPLENGKANLTGGGRVTEAQGKPAEPGQPACDLYGGYVFLPPCSPR